MPLVSEENSLGKPLNRCRDSPVWPMFANVQDLADEVEILVFLVSGRRDARFCCVLYVDHCCYGDTLCSGGKLIVWKLGKCRVNL
jgi:hypothetical protein